MTKIQTRIAAWALKQWPSVGPDELFVHQRPSSGSPEVPGLENTVAIISPARPFEIRYGWWKNQGFRKSDRSICVDLARNGGESDIGFDVTLFTLHAFGRLRWRPHTERFRSDPETHGYESRHTYLKLNYAGGWISAAVDKPDNGWSRSSPWWHRMDLSPRHFWGLNASETVELDKGRTVVPMPEGDYQAEWKLEHTKLSYTKLPGKIRDRLLGNRQWSRVSLDIPGCIPSWGKGENSWDCGMNGTCGVSGDTIEDAVANAVRSATRDRGRYGAVDIPQPMTISEAEAFLSATT